MSDARLRDLEARAERDPSARHALHAARARLGQFGCCGRQRPPGCGLCWHCREPGEVLVGEHRGGDRPRTVRHIVRLKLDWRWDHELDRAYVEQEDVFARCDQRYRGPGPSRWGTPTCGRCLHIAGLEGLTVQRYADRVADRLAWEQLVAFTRRPPTILHDGTPLLVPGQECPACGEGVLADVIEWETDTGIPGELHLACADPDCDEGGESWPVGRHWRDLIEEALEWSRKHVRVARG